MRLLLISGLASSLLGCTCFVPPQTTNDGMDGNAFACFGQRLTDPVIAPNRTVLQSDPGMRKAKFATIPNTKTRVSIRRAEKADPIRKPVNPMAMRKMEAARSTQPANKAVLGGKNPDSTPHVVATNHPAEAPRSGLPRPTDSIPVKTETPESTQPAGKAEPGVPQPNPVILAPPKPTPTAYTADHVLQRAMATIAAKVQDPSAEFRELKRAVRKNTLGKAIDTVCGYVKGKNAPDGDAEDRPFLYLVQEDEAYIVDGSRDIIAETAYRTICN
jgi:hypothetical protein